MPGPKNGIVGDDFGMSLPETTVDETQLVEEEKAARYSKSHEYKKLKAHWEARIQFYQRYLPDGRQLSEVPEEERGYMWLAANAIIAELSNAMNYYDTAEEMLKNRATIQ